MGRSFLRSAGLTTLFLSVSFYSIRTQAFERFPTDLIYGDDDRVEIENYNDSDFIEKSQSIAIRVSKKRLSVDRSDPEKTLFSLITLERAMPQLCKDEKFINQFSLGSCSGFLAGPKTLVTAGHCMVNEKECENNRWVFGFKDGMNELATKQVYSCQKIISQKYIYSDQEVSDYAVIELDRAVEGYVPLKRRKLGRVSLNTPLVVIGHPLGLPMKATDGGVVSRMNDIERETKIKSWWLKNNYFTANLDSYGGNSGSPVFNTNTGKVEGILIQGADDFVYNQEKDCMQSRKLKDHYLQTYEKVMRINRIPGL